MRRRADCKCERGEKKIVSLVSTVTELLQCVGDNFPCVCKRGDIVNLSHFQTCQLGGKGQGRHCLRAAKTGRWVKVRADAELLRDSHFERKLQVNAGDAITIL